MATITRTREMFTCEVETLERTSFWDTLCRAANRLFLPQWVEIYAEEKAEEIKRQHLYYC